VFGDGCTWARATSYTVQSTCPRVVLCVGSVLVVRPFQDRNGRVRIGVAAGDTAVGVHGAPSRFIRGIRYLVQGSVNVSGRWLSANRYRRLQQRASTDKGLVVLDALWRGRLVMVIYSGHKSADHLPACGTTLSGGRCYVCGLGPFISASTAADDPLDNEICTACAALRLLLLTGVRAPVRLPGEYYRDQPCTTAQPRRQPIP
jgi:hypothetical protein